MLVVGLTGGIGAGKSTFAALLAERGAQVIDADQLGRDALQPGRSSWRSVVDQFGEEILAPNTMQIDRRRLADIVFSDRAKLSALNAIVHPVIFAGVADALEKLRLTEAIVILDAALLVETGLDEACDVIVVVISEREDRLRRLQSTRGMTFDQIQNVMRAQNPAESSKKNADIVVKNDGSLDDLVAQAERVWSELQMWAER